MNPALRAAADPSHRASDRAALPVSLEANPRLSQWLRLRADGIVEVRVGKVELGQGILTALAQIAAEELDVGIERIRMIAANTASSPDEGITSGSRSIEQSGAALRHACAEARARYLDAAAAHLAVNVDSLRVEDGDIVASDATRTSYWQLADDRFLDAEPSVGARLKDPATHRCVGTPVQRLDLPDKIFGQPRYIHDLQPQRLLYGRVLRPPSPSATLKAIDESVARSLAGVVAVVKDGSFVGVLAEREETAVHALARLRESASWTQRSELPDATALADWLTAQPAETTVTAGHASARSSPVAKTHRARYTRPYLAHASIGPSCALAQWDDDALRVWSHTQGIYNLRADLALALRLPVERICVIHVEGAGCYGHNGADDVALDAALLARVASGRPVKVQWTREDELAWSPFGPAMMVGLEADLDVAGELLAWRCDVWSNGHTSRPGNAATPALLAAGFVEERFMLPIAINPSLAAGAGAERNAMPLYDIPAVRVVGHRLLTMPLRTSALRSLGAFANVFAIESFIDELAAQRGEDPIDYRLHRLADARAHAVIRAAARRAGWHGWQRREGRGHGVGFAKYKNTGAYCAVIAEIEAERDIRVRRLVLAVDVGLVINPDGVANQIEGGAIQATSWALKEAVRFDRERVTSISWEAYPILRFSEVPAVEVEIVARPDAPAVGAGEAAQGPTAAAIANAVFDALGVRVRDLPITPERIIAAAPQT